jgi:hypothetical protein
VAGEEDTDYREAMDALSNVPKGKELPMPSTRSTEEGDPPG